VRHAADRYDIVSLEIGQVFRPGVAGFYTVDFYRDVRARLREGGVVSQFLPISMLDPEMLRRSVSSFLRVFPHSTLWYNDVEMLLIGFGADTVAIDRARIARIAGADPVRGDLEYRYWGGPANALHRPEVLLAGLLCGSRGLSRLAAGAPPYTDDRPVLEYEASRTELGGGSEMAGIALLRDLLDPIAPLIGPPLSPDTLAVIEARRTRNLDYLYAVALSRRLQAEPGTVARLALLDSVVTACPGNGEVKRMIGNELVRAGRRAEAGGYYGAAAGINADDPAANRSLGLWLLDGNRAAEAAAYLERAVRLNPEVADARTDLGAALATLGRFEEAREQFRAALGLAPGDAMARTNLARVDEELARRGADPAVRRDRALQANPAR
jgi:spermidine synthase